MSKSRVSHRQRFVAKVTRTIRDRLPNASLARFSEARRFPQTGRHSPPESRKQAIQQQVEAIQGRAARYANVVNPSPIMQAKRNFYHNLRSKDFRALKRQKARQLVGVFVDYQVFRLRNSNLPGAKLLLAIYEKKLRLVDYVHQLTCDIRDLTTAIY